MGLDCYVYAEESDGSRSELWYGRKENEIHGWMQEKSGVPAEDFNCERFYLTEELINSLWQDCIAGKLVPTSGFFFGGANDEDQVRHEVFKICQRVQEALDYGKKVYYYSWW